MDVEKTMPALRPAAHDSISVYARCGSASDIESPFVCSPLSLPYVEQERQAGQPTAHFPPQLAEFDLACSCVSSGQLLSAVDFAIAKAIDDGAFSGIRLTVSGKLCPKCDGSGYKDHAGFAMDPCDHG